MLMIAIKKKELFQKKKLSQNRTVEKLKPKPDLNFENRKTEEPFYANLIKLKLTLMTNLLAGRFHWQGSL